MLAGRAAESRDVRQARRDLALAEFLYTVRAVREGMLTEGPTPEESRVLADHASYLEGLAKAGVVETAGRTQNLDASTFGIIILSADNESAARQVMENDPAVLGGVMRAELFPFRTAFRRRNQP